MENDVKAVEIKTVIGVVKKANGELGMVKAEEEIVKMIPQVRIFTSPTAAKGFISGYNAARQG